MSDNSNNTTDVLSTTPDSSQSTGNALQAGTDPLQGNPSDSDNATPASSTAVYTSELVGPGKKYSSIEQLEKAVAYSQEHIQKLEREAAERRAAENHSQTLEQILAKLSENPTSNTSQQAVDSVQTPATAALSEDTIGDLVKQQLEHINKSQQEENNYKAVNSRLVEFYGESRAKEIVKEKAQELGIDPVTMARQSPQALLHLLGVQSGKSASPITPTRESAINSQGALAPQVPSGNYDELVRKQQEQRQNIKRSGVQITSRDWQRDLKQRIAAIGTERFLNKR